MTEHRNIRLLYLHNFLIDLRFQSSFMVIYFSQVTGSYTAAMIVFAIDTLTAALMDIPTGVLSDKLGRKITIVLGSLLTTVAFTLYAVAHDFTLLAVAGFASGLGRCLFSGNNNALLYETLKSEGREDQFPHIQGRAGGMFQFALALSALCSSFLTQYGLKFIFILGVVPQILSVLVSLFFINPSAHVASEHKGLKHIKIALLKVYQNKRLLLLMFGQAISYGAGESTYDFKNAYVNQLWPTWAVGIFKAINHTLGFLGFWFSGRIVDRIKAPYMLAVAETYWFTTQLVAVIMSNVVTPLIMATGASVYGPFMVARDKLLQEEFTNEQRATMGSVASFMGSIVYTLIALGIGAISDHFSLALGVGFGIVMSACSLPIYVSIFKKYF